MTAAAAMPLVAALPQPAAARGPRYRKRRRTGSAAPESALFTGGPPTLGQVDSFIERQWATLARGLAKPLGGGRRPDFRQGDLLAGLALRYGRPEVLAALAAATALQPGWEARRAKWLAEDGAWRRRWASADTLTWSWHDGGVLTRSLLPLKLPA
jgi:hypothetical protein